MQQLNLFKPNSKNLFVVHGTRERGGKHTKSFTTFMEAQNYARQCVQRGWKPMVVRG